MKRDPLTETAQDIRDAAFNEIIMRGWFGRNSPSPGRSEAIDAREDNRTIHNTSQHSVALVLGWDFPKEPSRERDGPDHER